MRLDLCMSAFENTSKITKDDFSVLLEKAGGGSITNTNGVWREVIDFPNMVDW